MRNPLSLLTPPLLALGLGACGGGGGASGPPDTAPDNPAALERVRSDLDFSLPVDLAIDGQNRFYVLEQAGTIRRFDPAGSAPASLFLDIRDRVLDSGQEQGLLGMALDPDYSSNGHFYVNYTADNPQRTVIARFTDGASAASSEVIILEVEQPFANHNAGALVFGPSDGMLYIPLGDGGSGGDPQGHGQNGGTLLGSILRLDVSGSQRKGAAQNYAIPQDNPFVGNSEGIREEIYARGFRNPFRIRFDVPPGGAPVLWAGDVGQNAIEEVDIVMAGLNYGWNVMEGSQCFSPSSGCSSAGLTLPVAEYDHSVGVSITGGTVYRGSRRSDLAGDYLYADFATGALFALPADLSGPSERVGTLAINVAAFTRDTAGEVYLVDRGSGSNGGIHRFAVAAP